MKQLGDWICENVPLVSMLLVIGLFVSLDALIP